MATGDPAKQKALGRKVTPFDSEVWDAEARKYVLLGNLHKFSQNLGSSILLCISQLPELKFRLQNTGQKVLVEASPSDTIWGVGLAPDDPNLSNPKAWRGKNYLGIAVMQTRKRLVVEEVEHKL